MRNGSSGNKRQAAASEIGVPAKRPTGAFVPDELTTLRKIASSINAGMLALMGLPCTDVAARGRVVAVFAESHRQLNNLLGIKRRIAPVLAISDLVVDVFLFTSRKELDTLQIVSRRFNAIVEEKMATVCLRLLKSAKIERRWAENQLVLIMDEVGTTRLTRFPTGSLDETAVTTLLLDACRSSRLDCLQLYGTTPMGGELFDSLELRAPSIFLKNFCMGCRTLADGVPHDKVLQALQMFAELETATIGTAAKENNLQSCLIRTCFKAGVSVRSRTNRSDSRPTRWVTAAPPRPVSHVQVLDKKCDNRVVENALLEFSFGACDERYVTRERILRMELSKSMTKDFLRRWIEKAEVEDCRHELTLRISIDQSLKRQSAADLRAYLQPSQGDGKLHLGSVNGRRWAVTHSVSGENHEEIVFEINR